MHYTSILFLSHYLMLEQLLRLAVGHVAAHKRIVAAQFDPVRIVPAILLRCVGMTALGTLELDDNAIALLARHNSPLSV